MPITTIRLHRVLRTTPERIYRGFLTRAGPVVPARAQPKGDARQVRTRRGPQVMAGARQIKRSPA